MKVGTVVRTLAAGSALYVIMAACAASERMQAGNENDSEGGAAPSSSGASTSSSGVLVDALTDPVGEAAAHEPGPPDIATEQCDKTHGPYAYAEHAYPGVGANELALVVPVIAFTGSAPAGYTKQPTALSWVKDGAVAVICGSAAAPTITSVTFVRRR